jgi:hypothetical protein
LCRRGYLVTIDVVSVVIMDHHGKIRRWRSDGLRWRRFRSAVVLRVDPVVCGRIDMNCEMIMFTIIVFLIFVAPQHG